MGLRVNCGDDTTCGCNHGASAQTSAPPSGDKRRSSFSSNIDSTSFRRELHDGRDHLIIPVVMIRSDVVMNGAIVPDSEIEAFAWNGVPVTVGHPESDVGGSFISANSPDATEQWTVGRIFNSYTINGVLKAEAYIDVLKANDRHPGLIENILTSSSFDVSTGFYSVDLPSSGSSNGRSYSRVSTQLIPDHLALLPGEVGACSWEDGCGVRNRQEKTPMSKKLSDVMSKLLSAIQLKANERGRDDDWRQVIADLISDDRSPFLPDDLDGLSYMTVDSLIRVRNDYLGEPEGDGVVVNSAESGEGTVADPAKPEVTDPISANTKQPQGDPEMDTGNKADQKITLTANELEQMINSKVSAALQANALSSEDRDALANARTIIADQRKQTEARIIANSAMTQEQLDGLDTATLEIIANGLRPATDFSGRVVPVINAETTKDPAVAAMTSAPTVDQLIANRKKGA